MEGRGSSTLRQVLQKAEGRWLQGKEGCSCSRGIGWGETNTFVHTQNFSQTKSKQRVKGKKM